MDGIPPQLSVLRLVFSLEVINFNFCSFSEDMLLPVLGFWTGFEPHWPRGLRVDATDKAVDLKLIQNLIISRSCSPSPIAEVPSQTPASRYTERHSNAYHSSSLHVLSRWCFCTTSNRQQRYIAAMADIPSLLLASLVPSTRKQAEQALQAHSKQAGFLPGLLQLVLASGQERSVRLAGSVFLKNTTKSRWDDVCTYAFFSFWDLIVLPQEEASIIEADKVALRRNLVPAMIALSSPSDKTIRSQVAETISVVASYDFPDKWTDLIDVSPHFSVFNRDTHAVLCCCYAFNHRSLFPLCRIPTSRSMSVCCRLPIPYSTHGDLPQDLIHCSQLSTTSCHGLGGRSWNSSSIHAYTALEICQHRPQFIFGNDRSSTSQSCRSLL